MNFYGLAIAVVTFLIIGAFHPIVIKAEYHFTYRCWPVFLAAGLHTYRDQCFHKRPDNFMHPGRHWMQLPVEHQRAQGAARACSEGLVPREPGQNPVRLETPESPDLRTAGTDNIRDMAWLPRGLGIYLRHGHIINRKESPSWK